jgi:hypothetical protein
MIPFWSAVEMVLVVVLVASNSVALTTIACLCQIATGLFITITSSYFGLAFVTLGVHHLFAATHLYGSLIVVICGRQWKPVNVIMFFFWVMSVRLLHALFKSMGFIQQIDRWNDDSWYKKFDPTAVLTTTAMILLALCMVGFVANENAHLVARALATGLKALIMAKDTHVIAALLVSNAVGVVLFDSVLYAPAPPNLGSSPA